MRGGVGSGAGGGAMLGWAVPIGALNGFGGVALGEAGEGADCATPPGIISGADAAEGPGIGAGTAIRPAAVAAAIAGSSC